MRMLETMDAHFLSKQLLKTNLLIEISIHSTVFGILARNLKMEFIPMTWFPRDRSFQPFLVLPIFRCRKFGDLGETYIGEIILENDIITQ